MKYQLKGKNKLFFAASILLGCLLTFSVNSVHAQNVIINPNRIIFDGKKRADQVLVNNPSNEQQTYRVTFENLEMLDDGRFKEIKKGTEGKFADKMIRYSPRTFSLEPKSSQVVRLQLRKPAKLADGEYRSHMKVSVVPKAEAPTVQQKEGVNIKIQVHYGVTIPIIVRNGKLSFKTNVADFKLDKQLKKKKAVAKVKIDRTGDRSVYGDLSIIYIDKNKETTVLKFLPGVSIFTPNTFRTFEVQFDIPDDIDLSQGKVEVRYIDRETGLVSSSKSITL